MGEFYGAENDKGAMIMKVREGSPAEKAGIKADDIVVELQGEPVVGATELMNKVAMYKPGTEVELTVLRDGKKKKFTVALDKTARQFRTGLRRRIECPGGIWGCSFRP